MTGISTDNYNEAGISYDQMGNIVTLQRTYGTTTPIDNLTYTYTNTAGSYTNQVQSINDASPDASGYGYKSGTYGYLYDMNGNLQQDNSKAISNISYNVLNLPQVFTLSSGTDTYAYDADGRKLRKVSTAGTGATTDYIDGIEYDTGVLEFIQTTEGRALYNAGSPNYEYNLSDHLGDTRLTFDTHIATPTVVQQDDYYPFGYEINRNVSNPKNEYLYNRKELQEELQEEDYGARFYDPVTGRWNVIDAYAEHPDQIDLSTYAYVGNNPIDRTDPDGNCPPCDVPDQGDDGDLIRPTSEWYRLQHPDLAIIHDIAYAIVDFTGLKDLENSIGHTRDKNVSTKDKIGHVVQAAVNVLSLGEEGEGEGYHAPEFNFDEPFKEKIGRTEKQERLKEIANDDKQGSANRGWIKQEQNAIAKGKRTTIRNPPGTELAHERGREAAKGYSYKHAHLKNKADHKAQHRLDNNGRKNKERPH